MTEVSPERLVATMPVAGNTQPYGLLHGGASVVLAETLGSIGAQIHAGPGRVAVGLDINATHHRAARSGVVTGTATLLSAGRTLVSYDVVVTDEDGQARLHVADHLPAARRGAGGLTARSRGPGSAGDLRVVPRRPRRRAGRGGAAAGRATTRWGRGSPASLRWSVADDATRRTVSGAKPRRAKKRLASRSPAGTALARCSQPWRSA